MSELKECTELEQRFMALQALNGLLLSVLTNRGLLDLGIFQSNVEAIMASSEIGEAAHNDITRTFGVARLAAGLADVENRPSKN